MSEKSTAQSAAWSPCPTPGCDDFYPTGDRIRLCWDCWDKKSGFAAAEREIERAYAGLPLTASPDSGGGAGGENG